MTKHENLDMRSTSSVTKLLTEIANEFLATEVPSKTDMERANILLRVAKHSIQNIAMLLAAAKMRGVSGNDLKQLKHLEAK